MVQYDTPRSVSYDASWCTQRLPTNGTSHTIRGVGDPLVATYVAAGGRFLVCSPCAKKRGIGEDDLIEGATIVGGATLVALLADGAASLSF